MILRVIAGLVVGGALGALAGHFGRCSSGTCPLTSTPIRGALYGGVMGCFVALTMAGNGLRSEPQEVVGEEDIVKIEGVEQFDGTVLKAEQPVLVDFYSDHCGPCRRLAPTIGKLASNYKGRAVVAKANLDGGRNGKLARRYGIRGIPAVLFFHKGEVVEEIVGLRGEGDYAGVLDRLLAEAGHGDGTPQGASDSEL